MASELSQLIESELRKAEGANKPDEHQRRLASLRVKTGLEKPPPTVFERVCTTKRKVIAGGVLTLLVIILIVYAAASHRHHTAGPGSSDSLQLASTPAASTKMTKQATESNSDTDNTGPGTPDPYETDTDVIEPFEHTDFAAQRANATTSPSPEGNYTVIAALADDESQPPQDETQAHKQALTQNLMDAASPANAPAPLQDKQTAIPAPGPAVDAVTLIHNATVANAPAPGIG